MTLKKKLASVEVVERVAPANNSENLEIIKLAGMGWSIVTQKGIHKAGDKVLFVVIDTLVKRASWNEFLFVGSKVNDKTVRLSPVKLRGNVSNGIVVPLAKVTELNPTFLFRPKVGKDYSEKLGVVKYQKIPDEAQKSWFVQKYEYIVWKFFGKGSKPVAPKSPFPSYLTKTDEDNIQSQPGILDDFRDPKNGGIYITLKLDGSSITGFRKNANVSVASRSVLKNTEDSDEFTEWLAEPGVSEAIVEGKYVQGERVGPKMCGNKMKFETRKTIVFQVANIGNNEILDYVDFVNYCDAMNLERSPEIPVPDGWKNFGIEDWIAFSEKVAKYGNEPGEGIVIRTKRNINANRYGSHCGRLSAKVLNPAYCDK